MCVCGCGCVGVCVCVDIDRYRYMCLSFEHMAAHLCVEKLDFVRPLVDCVSTTYLAPAEFKMKFLILSY